MDATQKPNMMEFKKIACDKLIDILQSVSGKKDLFIEPSFMRPLDRIAGLSILKNNDVDKIFKFEPTVPAASSGNKRVYLIRATVASTNMVANHINNSLSTSTDKISYRIVFVPRMLAVCSRILERAGVYGYASYNDFQFDFIPIEQDLISMEMPEFFPSFFLHGDMTCLHSAAKALVNLQVMYNLIPNVYAIGKCANLVKELVKKLMAVDGFPRTTVNGGLGHVFLIDRNVDYVTPLCSQLVYEGLLDDIFGISCGYIELSPDVTGSQEPVRLQLSSQDAIYREIRDEHFSRISVFLKAKTQNLQQEFNKGKNSESVGKMKEFVSNDLGKLKQEQRSLALHISASEAIVKKTRGSYEEVLQAEQNILEGIDYKEIVGFIEQHVAEQACAHHSLRLMCLLSVTLGGLPTTVYQSLTLQFLQAYGFELMPLLSSLQKVGLWTTEDSEGQGKFAKLIYKSSQFRALCKKLNITPKTINLESRPSDVSFLFNGTFAPLSCKIVEQILLHDGFTGLDDLVKLLPDPCKAECLSTSARERPGSSSSKYVVVFFLGGCSYSEVAALRFIARTKGLNIIIATTSMVNGKTLLQVSEPLLPSPS